MLPELPTTSIIHEKQVAGVIILTVGRGLKGMGEAALKQRLDSLVQQGHLEILIDMQHMPNLDSTELGRLIRSHISLRQAGGKVRLCNLSPRVVTLMQMTGLTTILEIYNTEEDALARIRHHRDGQSRGMT